MSEAKHTPGEWVVSPPLDGTFTLGGDSCEVVALNGDGMVSRNICTCLLDTDSHPDGAEWLEDAANARLIAAAPNLLRDARLLLERMVMIRQAIPGGCGMTLEERNLLTTIQQATGEPAR